MHDYCVTTFPDTFWSGLENVPGMRVPATPGPDTSFLNPFVLSAFWVKSVDRVDARLSSLSLVGPNRSTGVSLSTIHVKNGPSARIGPVLRSNKSRSAQTNHRSPLQTTSSFRAEQQNWQSCPSFLSRQLLILYADRVPHASLFLPVRGIFFAEARPGPAKLATTDVTCIPWADSDGVSST